MAREVLPALDDSPVVRESPIHAAIEPGRNAHQSGIQREIRPAKIGPSELEGSGQNPIASRASHQKTDMRAT